MKIGYSFDSLVTFVENLDKTVVKLSGDQTIAGTKTFSAIPLTSVAQGTTANQLVRYDTLTRYALLTGATFTGNVTSTAFLIRDAQDTAVNAATRKDYVDGLLTTTVKLTGDQTVAGVKTFSSNPLSSAAQSTSASALVRYDYMNTELGKKLNLSGGTMTGVITSTSEDASPILLNRGLQVSIGYKVTATLTKFLGFDIGGLLRIHTTSNLTQGGYVYTTENKPTTGDIGAVAKAGDTMTGNLTMDGKNVTINKAMSTDAQFEAIDGTTKGIFRTSAGDAILGTMVGSDWKGFIRVGPNGGFSYTTASGATHKVYHQGFNPSATDVGAAAVVSNKIVVPAYSGGLGATIKNQNASGYESWLTSRPDNDSAHKAIGVHETDGPVYWDGGKRRSIYHTGYKPTAGDLNAYTKTETDTLLNAKANLAGATFTGTVTGTKFLLSAAQGTEVDALTRKDYVDGLIATRVKLTDDQTIAGTKTFSTNPLSSAAQSTAATALVRYDFLLNQMNTTVKLTGDQTVAGVKTFSANPISSANQNTASNALVRYDTLTNSLAGYLPLTGGTLTKGAGGSVLTMASNANTQNMLLGMTGGQMDWCVGRDNASSGNVALSSFRHGVSLSLESGLIRSSAQLYEGSNRVFSTAYRPTLTAMGWLNHGQQIPLPSGFNQESCNWIVSPREILMAENAAPWSVKLTCYADSNRIVFAFGSQDDGVGQILGSANFIIIGVR